MTVEASAPEELILSVIDALRRLCPVEVTQMDGIREDIEFRLPAELIMPAEAAEVETVQAEAALT